MLMTACASPSQPALNRLPVELGLVHHGCAGSTMRLATTIALVLATVLGAIPGDAQTPAALAISNGGYQNSPVLRATRRALLLLRRVPAPARRGRARGCRAGGQAARRRP